MLLQRKLQNVLMISVFVFVGLLLIVSISLAQSGTWIKKTDIPTARCFASSCELDSKIYVIGGGKTSNSRLNVMEIYDPATDTWDTSKTNMPTARAELCVAAVNGKIYAIGGAYSHSGSTLGMVEVYDPLTDTWDTNKTPMPTPRKGAACGIINDKIYIAGGTAVSNWIPSSSKLEIYDPATDTWDNTKTNMPNAILNTQGVVVNDTFYVIGGLVGSPWIGQNTVQIYDPTTDNWSLGADLKNGRVGHTTDAFDGKIYAVGGESQFIPDTTVEVYDPHSKSWAVIDQTPAVMNIHTSSVYGNEIFIFSGTTMGITQLTLTNSVYSYDLALSSIECRKNLKPDIFVLHQNYPNPFNPSTSIEFSLPKSEYVELKVYNILGKEVMILVSKKLNKGDHTYQFVGRNLASGVYYYQLVAGQYEEVKKMILLK